MAKLKLTRPDRANLQSIYDLITKDPFVHHTIEGLGYENGMNKTKLSYGFKQLFGMGIYEYQMNLRLSRAEKYLLDSDMTVEQIAFLTGYKTKSSFTVAFKKKNKIAPGQWRKEKGEEESMSWVL